MASQLTLRPKGYFGPGSIEVEPPARPGEGGVRRLALERAALIERPASGIDTIPDVIIYAARIHGKEKAMGWRDVIDIHEEKKRIKKVVDGREVTEEKSWKYFELSDYKYIDYVELEGAISEAARGLVELGVAKGDVFDLFAETSPNWQIISHACSTISTTIATAYDTLGESGLKHSLNEPKCVGIYTNPPLLKTLLKVLPETPSVRLIIHDGTADAALVSQIRSLRSENPITVMHIEALRALGRPLSVSTLADRKPTRDTLACIMYTSGTTGPPKGVCLTHANLISALGAINPIFGPHIAPGSRYLSYLPLAHVLEYIVELYAVYVGATCGYARPKTLTDASVRGCKGDLRAFKPHIMLGVPAVWETMRKAIVGRVEKAGWVASKAFWGGLRLKRLLLGTVTEAMGGEMRFAVNGGAAIGRETQDFFNLAVMPLTQGYGLTETCGMCALLPPELLSVGPVGVPAPSVEIKLLDCPEMGYFSSTDSSSSSTTSHLPQGEVCIRGPSVTSGYFNRPDLNNDEEIFTKDGWFRTGDVGQWNEDGTLSIIDRLKNLVKMQSGEYIALERLEAIYKTCKLATNLCLYAESDMQQPIAIVCPRESALRRALKSNGNGKAKPNGTVTPTTAEPSTSEASSKSAFVELCALPAARNKVLKELQAIAKKQGLARAEIPSGVVLSPDEWTSANGMVTAAAKVNRAKVRSTMDFLKGKSSNTSTGNTQNPSGGGGFMDKMNSSMGGGQSGETNEDMLDKGVDFVQERFLGGGSQKNESAAEQAKDERISDAIRSGYKSATGKDFPVSDK
ncbi:hypothetical protein NLJ89_g568 [Agrocybe chaxingu]|uniref:AMP-dependent synthetase/ligase domain-containing protein n=1 Tax=Agrocybe chaxingu TaxID=84603 RepID=A0A9W8N1L0_9AGAR|nr:hypothetical protein NLJ89_g568 [Agrocybe chaxingu]